MATSLIRRNQNLHPWNFTKDHAGSIFEGFLSTLLDDFYDVPPGRVGTTDKNVAVSNLEDVYEIAIAVPGIAKKDINIAIESSQLNISYEASEENNPRSFFKQSFSRSWTLPSGVSAKDISAKQRNGILTITVKKPESEVMKSQTIPVG